ncbi:hypothetical protein CTI12_AA336450 [Artemisia annua]|uniref:Uncharacterized protein n=1 Tax=Artemisia annua TaxID=35608 RepID=A0A2U1MVW6_ARTAN|nr:hypothetical protein CTI12_AA336450 [Artemisia annua]
MVLVDLRNHGRSTDRESLSPPHDSPDVVIRHSLGGKMVLQYGLSCAQGDYGGSTQIPKQEALYSLKTLPTPIPSKE